MIVAITSLDFIWNFNSFGLVYVLTAGGPGGKTMLPMLFAYNEAFRYGNFGYAAAMGNVMVVIIVVLLAASTCALRLRRRASMRRLDPSRAARGAASTSALSRLPALPRFPLAVAAVRRRSRARSELVVDRIRA